MLTGALDLTTLPCSIMRYLQLLHESRGISQLKCQVMCLCSLNFVCDMISLSNWWCKQKYFVLNYVKQYHIRIAISFYYQHQFSATYLERVRPISDRYWNVFTSKFHLNNILNALGSVSLLILFSVSLLETFPKGMGLE